MFSGVSLFIKLNMKELLTDISNSVIKDCTAKAESSPLLPHLYFNGQVSLKPDADVVMERQPSH